MLTPLAFSLNGDAVEVVVDTRTTLLDLLRGDLRLTGAKVGCDHGQCGACTVLIDGLRSNSCLVLAVQLQAASVVTIEGLGDGEALHPVQQAFVDNDALQCGFCTPGQICSTVGMLAEAEQGWPSAATADVAGTTVVLDDREIRERMSGNICRCGAYVNIVAAVREVSA